MLKWICDKIDLIFIDTKAGSKLEDGEIYYRNGFFSYSNKCGVRYLDVREVIFTQEFMNKYYQYFNDTFLGLGDEVVNVLNNLDDPVSYLYNLLKDEKN